MINAPASGNSVELNAREYNMRSSLNWVDAPARILMSLLFLVSGYSKVTATAAIQAYMEHAGVPGILIWPAAALELGGGLALLVGFGVRPLALVLAAWCVLTAAIFHTDFADQNQMLNFLKNLAMCGGFLIVARSGAPGAGLDARLAARKG